MAKTRHQDEDNTAELSIYVPPSMRDDLVKLAKAKGVSVSTLGRWAFQTLLKDQKR